MDVKASTVVTCSRHRDHRVRPSHPAIRQFRRRCGEHLFPLAVSCICTQRVWPFPRPSWVRFADRKGCGVRSAFASWFAAGGGRRAGLIAVIAGGAGAACRGWGHPAQSPAPSRSTRPPPPRCGTRCPFRRRLCKAVQSPAFASGAVWPCCGQARRRAVPQTEAQVRRFDPLCRRHSCAARCGCPRSAFHWPAGERECSR
jgi:hypothetical protein